MFIGVYELDGKTYNYIYYNWSEWFTDTFCIDKIVGILDLQVKGNNYAEKKAYAEDLAIEYQLHYASYDWSYGELYEIGNYFETIGRRYGLLGVFRENAIC